MGKRTWRQARHRAPCRLTCTAPAAWCETHHVLPWQLGGTTDIDCLTLLCGFHHREFERRGWSVQIINGVPWWTPPKWIDPDQTPRRNHAHHLDQVAITAFRRQVAEQRTAEQPRAPDNPG